MLLEGIEREHWPGMAQSKGRSSRKFSIKKLFLKILQYSQENNCIGVPF